MSKFLYSLAIEGTRQQLEELIPKLVALGYKTPSYAPNNFLVNDFNNENGRLDYNQEKGMVSRGLVNASNPDYVLALAAMREGPEFYPGEAVISLITSGSQHNYVAGALYIILNVAGERISAVVDSNGNRDNGFNISNFRKATFEEITNHFMKDSFKLPEKWYVKNPYNGDSELLYQYANKHGANPPYEWGEYFHFPITKEGYTTTANAPKINEEYVEITMEQFKQYVLNQSNMSKKIIGYKAPISYFGGKIIAGTIYKPIASVNNTVYCAINERGSSVDSGQTNLPKEIVETWKPVFKEEKVTLVLGSNATEVEIENGKIDARGTTWNKEVLRNIKTYYQKLHTASGYNVTIDRGTRCIRIGCENENNLFSIEEINQVLYAAEEQSKS